MDGISAGDMKLAASRLLGCIGVPRCASLHDKGCTLVMGQDEDRGTIRRLLAPPAAPVEVPGAAACTRIR
jgi:hypothetical protein